MAGYTTVEDWRAVQEGYVVDVTIRRTTDEQYPSGWDYSLQFGVLAGQTIVRYDNAHELMKGHERHAGDDVERIEFPGMLALYDRFKRETKSATSVSWDWTR